MKKVSKILILGFFLLFLSCGPIPNCGKWVVTITNDNNFTSDRIICDSIQMYSKTHAEIWIDGKKSIIKAERITPAYRPCN